MAQQYVVVFLLVSFCLAAGDEFSSPGAPDVCLEGPFHKETPSPEEQSFHECLSWQDEACCNVNLSLTIDRHKAVGLYNYSWDHCGVLSQQCEEFIKDEECFYQCEPMLWYFRIPSTAGYISGVPVCASYCDRWFDACKTDLTCVEDWLADFDYALDGANSCPDNSSCVTFEERYGNGEGLCNRMWGSAFVYSTDEDNCTVMAFDNTNGNPNYQLSFSTDNAGSGNVVQFSMLLLLIVIIISYMTI